MKNKELNDKLKPDLNKISTEGLCVLVNIITEEIKQRIKEE